MNQVATMKAEAFKTRKPRTWRRLRTPAGKWRPAVRGLSLSISASARRLKAMAVFRQVTMQTRISAKVLGDGMPPAAQTMAAKAKGRAKRVWENLTRPKKCFRPERLIVDMGEK